jgi:AraC family transcriptional regulator
MAVEAAALELLARVTRTARHEHRPRWLEEARSVLHDRFAESLTLDDVAIAVGVEPERLARAFRRTLGEPMAEYLRRIRVDAAAAFLATTNLPISQVAADVGFADQSHLTRWFGRYLGTTPAQYREARGRSRGITAT